MRRRGAACPAWLVARAHDTHRGPRKEQATRELEIFAEEEARNRTEAEVIASDAVVEALAGCADEGDLLVLGLQRHRGKRLFGELALQVARRTRAATLLISRRR